MQFKTTTFILITSILSFFVGCGSPQQEAQSAAPTETTEQESSDTSYEDEFEFPEETEQNDARGIIGGRPAAPSDSTSNAVVGISYLTSKGRLVGCSATLVTPYAAVTAAHCLNPKKVPLKELAVFLGRNSLEKPESQNPELLIPVSRFVVHPEYDPAAETRLFDIAVIFLSRRASVRPIRLAFGAFHPRATGHSVRLIGYGADHVTSEEKGGAGNGIRRSGISFIRGLFSGFFLISDPYAAQKGIGVSPFHGDSGGAVLMKSRRGTEYLVGVIKGEVPQVRLGGATPIDLYRSFLLQVLLGNGR